MKLGMTSLAYPSMQNVFRLSLASQALYVADSHAETTCSLVTVDSTLFTIDSTLFNISYGVSTSDNDCDGLSNADEFLNHNTRLWFADTDRDGLDDGIEVIVYGTDPLNSDSDGDGFSDTEEVFAFSDPLDPASSPVIADGDVNLDGKVDAGDITKLQRIVIDDEQFTPSQLQHADVAPLVNGEPAPDGKLNAGDLIVLTRKVLGKINF